MEFLNNYFNEGAEQKLLAEIMVDNTILEELDVREDDFYGIRNRNIFNCICDLYSSKQKIDVVSLHQKLKDKGMLDNAGGMKYVLELNSNTFTANGWKTHADIIKNCSFKRNWKGMLREGLAYLEEDLTPDELVANLQQRINAIDGRGKSNELTSVFGSFSKDVEDLKSRMNDDSAGLCCDFIDLDNMTGGFVNSDLIILAARPAMGKTAFALNIAKNVAVKGGRVMVVSLEMGAEQLRHRVESSLTGVEASKFRSPSKLSKDDWKRLESASKRVIGGDVFVWDKPNATVTGIKRKARLLQHSKGLDLIIVDYLQLMEGDRKSENRTQQVSSISRGLKLLARELNIPVIVLSQLNRGLEERANKRPMLSDLRESGSIEQDADMVMFLYRDTYYNPDSDDTHTELIIGKHRHGPTGRVYLFFDDKTTTFVSLSKENYHP